MNTKDILVEIDAEIALLQQVREILTGVMSRAASRNGNGKHSMSAEGRARISAAQKKRWAKTRRAAKSAHGSGAAEERLLSA